jgi:1-acyl-sn-glycerol-3-phosphate acyltransferase
LTHTALIVIHEHVMHRLPNFAFTPFWTAGVTVTAVAIARLSGQGHFITEGERLWARGLLKTWGVTVDVEGLEHLPSQAPYILMANHQSHVDVPILFASLPIIPGFLAKKELGKIPFLAMALRAGGHVLIDRSDRSSAMRVLKNAAEEVRSGKTLAVFPEGTRGAEDRLAPFKKGAFLIAKKAGVPIVPVGIRGSRAILKRDEWLPRAGRVQLMVGKAISFDEIRSMDVEALIERTYQSIAGLLGWPMVSEQVRKSENDGGKSAANVEDGASSHAARTE